MKKITKVYAVESKAVDVEAGIYEAWVSTEDVDRDGDIMLADGADTSNYAKNPIVLFGHDYRNPEAVVARTIEIQKQAGKGIKLMFQFIERGISKAADLVHDLWAKRYLNAMSVGFIPQKWEKRTDDNGEELQRGFLFTEWQMLEGSIVTVPANQDALRAAYGGKYDEETLGKVFDLPKPKNENTGEEDPPVIDEPAPEPTEQEEPQPESSEEPTTDQPPHDESDPELDTIADDLIETVDDLLEVLQ
jgi:HK97 family phage prohead protease